MRTWIATGACMVALIGARQATAAAPAACSDPDRPKCTIALSTGITMRYHEVGPSSGPAVFLLHGYTDTSRSLSLVMAALHRLQPQLDLIAPDLRGHGQSSMPTGAGCAADPGSCFRPIDFARDIVAFMDQRHIRRATFVGHSMGTLVAQELGLSFPDRVSKLVLISTATEGQSEPAVVGLLYGLIDPVWAPAFVAAGYTWPNGAYAVSPEGVVPGFDDFLSFSWDADAVADPTFVSQVISETSATAAGTWLGALEGIVATDNTQRLEHLRTPTFAVWATQDAVFSRDIEQQLIDSLTIAAQNGGSFWWKQYGVLSPPADGSQTDFAHNVVWEAPGALALDIASFLVTGRPTNVLFHSDYPADIHRVVAEPGKAVVLHAP
jgi:pimeloyl-ACP methyl ester carboxylesterase